MKQGYILKSRFEGFARADEMIALALFDNGKGYYFDMDDARVKQLHRELFASEIKCARCEGKHATSRCPIREDYDVEKSADSPKKGSCCDPPKKID